MAILLHFFLDTRATEGDAPAPLKLAVSKRSQTAFVLTGVSLRPSEWEQKAQRVVNHPRRKNLNSDLARMKAEAEDYLRPMLYNGELAELSATQIKDLLKSHFYGSISAAKLADAYQSYLAPKGAGTAHIYRAAWARLCAFHPSAGTMPLRDLNPAFVGKLSSWLNENYAPNTAATTLRCLRAVWNQAAKEGKCSGNPFAAVRTGATAGQSRDLSLAQIRMLWRAETKSPKEAEALDFFKLSFLLRAMNPADLLAAREGDLSNGRLYYSRRKTGKAISVKIEPEAAEIIERRKGGGCLFHSRVEKAALHNEVNTYLKAIAKRLGLPPVSMYWARHTLASLLFEQGGSMDVVSAILSHSLGGARVTATYVAVRESKLDEAMRSVIDAVINEEGGV